MDGTLISSIAAAERVWSAWANRHGIDVATFLPTIHGVRAVDTIGRQGLTGIDIDAEVTWITQGEIEDVEGVVQIEGIAHFLNALPGDRWAIVTSASNALARRRLEAAGIVAPEVIITADDIKRGKPNPDCFLLGAEKLGVTPENCLVFEDAPAGITAAEAAGCDVVVITATHQHPVSTEHLTIKDYNGLAVTILPDGRMRLGIR